MSLPARIAWALELLAPARGERVLEIGCGSGVAAAELVAAGCEVTALDRSAKAIEAAAARLGGRSRLICGALETADLPAAAKRYIARLEEVTGVPVGILSLGPRCSETLFLNGEA